jgi:hypothetical protein
MVLFAVDEDEALLGVALCPRRVERRVLGMRVGATTMEVDLALILGCTDGATLLTCIHDIVCLGHSSSPWGLPAFFADGRKLEIIRFGLIHDCPNLRQRCILAKIIELAQVV